MRTPWLLVGAGVVAWLAGCARNAAPPASLSGGQHVALAQVVAVKGVRFQAVAGTVRPLARALVSSRSGGQVLSAGFRIGQVVAAGELLVRLDAAEQRAQVIQAKVNLGQAERELSRETNLLNKDASTTETVRSLEERRQLMAAALTEAEARLAYTEVKAPFSGVVTDRLVSAGDFTAPGTPLFELEGLDHFQVTTEIPESLPAMATGAEVVVVAGERRIKATLTEYSPAADTVSRTRLAKVDLPAVSPFRSGDFVRILWPAGQRWSLILPAGALSRFGQMERVFVVADGRARLRLVRTAELPDGRIEVLSGVADGEWAVVDPPAGLRDGQTVKEKQ